MGALLQAHVLLRTGHSDRSEAQLQNVDRSTLRKDALPSGPPDREWKRDGKLYQAWEMNAGPQQAVYQVDCLYNGSKRNLRLDASKVKRCLGRWRLRGEKVVQRSLIFECE